MLHQCFTNVWSQFGYNFCNSCIDKNDIVIRNNLVSRTKHP